MVIVWQRAVYNTTYNGNKFAAMQRQQHRLPHIATQWLLCGITGSCIKSKYITKIKLYTILFISTLGSYFPLIRIRLAFERVVGKIRYRIGAEVSSKYNPPNEHTLKHCTVLWALFRCFTLAGDVSFFLSLFRSLWWIQIYVNTRKSN